MCSALTLAPALALALTAGSALAADWTNTGGNSLRNGFNDVLGPVAADQAWSTPEFSIIAWSPVTLGDRVFVVKESGFPTNGGQANDTCVAYRLDNGQEIWRRSLPFSGNTTQDWIAWIAGARDGKVYASRSGNGASVSQVMYALDAATGNTVWTSQAPTAAGSYDGVVFAPDGDLIVGDFRNVTRIDSIDGHTVWRIGRVGSVSGNCGAAASSTAVYIVDAVVGGHSVKKLDIDTGAMQYQSPVMTGFTSQNSPFLSHDGQTVYFARSQNNQPVDNFFAFRDTGSSFTLLWSRPVKWTTSHEHGIAADGSIYTFIPAPDGVSDSFVRLNPLDGAVVGTAPVLNPLRSVNLSPRTAIGGDGTVYLSNGWASNPATDGRLWAFTPDLSQILFELPLDRQNIGGPALAHDGSLIVSDRNGVRAYRSDRCQADFNGDNQVDFFDYLDFVAAFDAEDDSADFNGDNQVDFFDYLDFAQEFDTGCD
jgi:outer membrane protein assembly factor BamB